MSESWKQWEGQIVDARFLLRRYLGGSEHSAVFLTERGIPPQKVAIKFVQFDEPDAELQLFRWKHAAKLSHPHLLRIYESGRCHLGDFDLLYVVMEYAEENLSQFLPQRPLTPAEARDVLTPTLQALAFLHGEGLVHGHVRPSNILAIEDQLKLSSDGISSADEHAERSLLPAADPQQPQQTVYAASLRHPSPYDPPEIAKGIVSPAGDIWSLGLTLVEALTQRLPATLAGVPQDPVVPDTLPAIFQDIARHCLHRDPQRRWTVVEVGARLNPGTIPPSASAAKPSSAPSPEQVAAAIAPAIIAASPRPAASAAVAPANAEPVRPTPPPAPRPEVHTQTVAIRGTATRPRYDLVQPQLKRPPLLPPLPKINFLPLAVIAALVLTAIFVGPRLLRHRTPAQQTASVEPQPAAANPVPAATHAKNAAKSQQKSSAQKSAPVVASAAPPVSQHASQAPSQSSPQKNNDKRSLTPSTPAPSTASLTSVANPPRVEAVANSSGSVIPGEVLEQVMPEVSPGARATIRGTVRVAVKLHVDTAGNVSSAELFSPGPSRYFADQALQAAHRWDFAPAKVDGHAVPSDWLVHFEFTPSITKAHPTQSTP